MKQGAYVERYVDAVSCIKKAPRTVRQLCEVVGMSEAPMIRLVKAMHSEGLIEPAGFAPAAESGGQAATKWSWVP